MLFAMKSTMTANSAAVYLVSSRRPSVSMGDQIWAIATRACPFEVELVAAVSDRRKGQSVLDAFRDVLVERSRGFATRDDARGAALGARLISESASLRRRELEIVADHTKTLAEILAAETEATDRDVRPFVVANALMGVHRALIDLVRRLAVEGVSAAKIGSRVAEQAELGLAALQEGLGDYGSR
jgi:hypothetical protein